MGRLWSQYNWSSAKALNGLLLALGLPLPYLYYSFHLVATCPADSFWTWDVLSLCGGGTHFAVLSLVLLFLPMYVVGTILDNGWLVDLSWSIVPVFALLHYTLVALRFVPNVNEFRLGLLWGVVLLWAVRLSHNYCRREEWTWGAREDFRYQTMRKQFGWHWKWISLFVQYTVSQWLPEVLFSLPYYYIATDTRPIDWIDYSCAILAVASLIGAWLSDNSLREFVEAPNTRGKVLQSGLWAYSRHPNYLAESTFHWAPALWALRSAHPLVLSGAVLNSFILFVTCFLTEQHFLAGERRLEYLKYCQRVRMIL